MSYPTVYQPALPAVLIKGLHHEAQLQHKPMTKLLAEIVASALEHTEGMRVAREEITAQCACATSHHRYQTAA